MTATVRVALLPDPIPPAVAPRPAWLDEAKTAAALRGSARRTLPGRW